MSQITNCDNISIFITKDQLHPNPCNGDLEEDIRVIGNLVYHNILLPRHQSISLKIIPPWAIFIRMYI